MPPATKATPATAKTAAQKALDKLGLRRDIDLALHLPLRYEDETRIILLADARDAGRPAACFIIGGAGAGQRQMQAARPRLMAVQTGFAPCKLCLAPPARAAAATARHVDHASAESPFQLR